MLDLPAARRWAVTSRALLSDSREHINGLNVFPVPDGDTGTNMFLTVDGALGTLRDPAAGEGEAFRLRDGLALLAHGMLLSARGNSGVILSQLALGMSQAVDASHEPDAPFMAPDVLVDALGRAADVAWAGVAEPVEGTILSVARAAAAGAVEAELRGSDVAEQTHALAAAALQAARQALARTPEQLPRLAQAGVVDAGGAGFVLVLEALETVLSGRAVEVSRPGQDSRQLVERHHLSTHSVGDDGAVEVMYLVRGCGAEAAAHLREDLLAVGSSVMVVGASGLWRVHVHLDDPEAALDAGSRHGDVEQVSITSLRPEDPSPASRAAAEDLPVMTNGLVSCASGPGLAQLFSDAGARVVRSSAGNRASTGVLLQACRDTGADHLVVLPNDPDTILAAQAAAAQGAAEGLDIRVVPTLSAVQGLAAVSLWGPDQTSPGEDRGRSQPGPSRLDEQVARMTEAADAVQYAALTVAVADASTAAGPCRTGQWLGVVGTTITAVHDDVTAVAQEVLEALEGALPAEPGLLTVLTGHEVSGPVSETFDQVLLRWGAERPDVEVQRHHGGQRTYRWLLGME